MESFPEYTAEEEATGDVVLLFVPAETYKALSGAAICRNMSVGELMARALDAYLEEKTEE